MDEMCIRFKDFKCELGFRASERCKHSEIRHECDRHVTEAERADMESPDGTWEKVEYPEHYEWQQSHKRLMCKEPGPNVIRCPRCYSLDYKVGYPNIVCGHCGYAEPLIDFPISDDFRRWLEVRRR